MQICGKIRIGSYVDGSRKWVWSIDIGPESERGVFRREAVVESERTYKSAQSASKAANQWLKRLQLKAKSN